MPRRVSTLIAVAFGSLLACARSERRGDVALGGTGGREPAGGAGAAAGESGAEAGAGGSGAGLGAAGAGSGGAHAGGPAAGGDTAGGAAEGLGGVDSGGAVGVGGQPIGGAGAGGSGGLGGSPPIGGAGAGVGGSIGVGGAPGPFKCVTDLYADCWPESAVCLDDAERSEVCYSGGVRVLTEPLAGGCANAVKKTYFKADGSVCFSTTSGAYQSQACEVFTNTVSDGEGNPVASSSTGAPRCVDGSTEACDASQGHCSWPSFTCPPGDCSTL
jgi:hypothetical protein